MLKYGLLKSSSGSNTKVPKVKEDFRTSETNWSWNLLASFKPFAQNFENQSAKILLIFQNL